MRARRSAAVVVSCTVLGVTGWTTPARADFSLEWDAPAECPDRASVLARMQRLLGSPPGGLRGRDLAVRANVARVTSEGDRPTWRVALSSRTPDGPAERTVEGVSCERVTDAAALILSMALDPDAVATHLGAPPAEPPPPRTDLGIWARAAALADVGSMPKVSPGLALAFGLSLARVWIEGEARAWLAQRVDVPNMPGVGGDFHPAAGALRACFAFGERPLSAGPCAGASVGWMSGRGYGITDPKTGGSVWIDAFVGAALRVRLGSVFAVRGDLELDTYLVDPRYTIGGVGTVHHAPFVFGSGDLGIEAHFR